MRNQPQNPRHGPCRRLGSVHAALGGTHRGAAASAASAAAAAGGAAAAADPPALPHVVVIGTGGTIAGSQEKDVEGTLGSYRAGALAVGSLVAGLPQAELAKHATVDSEQFLNVARYILNCTGTPHNNLISRDGGDCLRILTR